MLEKKVRGERGGKKEGGGGGDGGGEGGGRGKSMAVIDLMKAQLKRVRGEIERERTIEKDLLQKLQVREYGE